MIEVLVWLLVATSAGGSNYGTSTVIGQFKSKEDCEAVDYKLPGSRYFASACIQANIYIKD